MRLRNRKTGEIVENAYIRETHDFYRHNKRTIAVFVRDGNHPPERVSTGYETLAELNAEWCDVLEMQGYWYINEFGSPIEMTYTRENMFDKARKNFGNYFESEEEAKRVVEKLKAFRRLRDKGFRFTGYSEKDREYIHQIEIYAEANPDGKAVDLAEDSDIKLLFGGMNER